MGKRTLYHPVSLYVIRGAAEYCGWRFGKIKQYYAVPEFGAARYAAEITKMPKAVWGRPYDIIQSTLQECFMDDIRVHWLRQSKNKKWYCDLAVKLESKPDGDEPLLSLEEYLGQANGADGAQ